MQGESTEKTEITEQTEKRLERPFEFPFFLLSEAEVKNNEEGQYHIMRNTQSFFPPSPEYFPHSLFNHLPAPMLQA
jgi:hypothetical protein